MPGIVLSPGNRAGNEISYALREFTLGLNPKKSPTY